MKLINILLVVFAFCFSSSVFAKKNLPNVNVKDLKGKTINIQDFAKNGMYPDCSKKSVSPGVASSAICRPISER